MFNLSTFDCMTSVERAFYNSWKKAADKDKKIMREEYQNKIEEFCEVREISFDCIYEKNNIPKEDKVIASFENECVRLSESFIYDENNPKNIPLVQEIVILDCHHEKILEQIIYKGILIANKKFIVYSSSPNQQKKKQVCLIQEEFHDKHKNKLMCGLTIDIINEKGGCNTGKYLAYTSLIFSKSVELEHEIDINEVLIVPEFETKVKANVNYLSIEDNSMEEKEMLVPVNHMDGAGIFIPGLLPSSAQIRGGWIKGCVFPFDFHQFIIEKQNDGTICSEASIKDAWGTSISINHIRENIKLILNTSQLKMWKKYNSWDEYKKAFKDNDLKLCINNIVHYPEDDDPVVQGSYQFEQTIPRCNIKDKNIEELSKLTVQMINDAKTEPEAALKIMGINLEKDSILDPLYGAIKEYPNMLQDPYVRKRINSKIESIRKCAMGGKPFIRGFYSYICPDLYAACEYWLCNQDIPNGLIPANSVYNSFYNDKDVIKEIVCLRSPHLSDCEHGVRRLEKSDDCKKWFVGMDTVISTHDLLTKTLQCDVDGDECLNVHDKAFINLVDRDKLPLYYEMKKGADVEVNNENMYDCLLNSFGNSIIGDISNALTKHLNSQQEPDLRFVRFMTAYNNFIIDLPKTQYKPELPQEYQSMFEELMVQEFPYFFHYAKDKKYSGCYTYQENEKSTVNRLSKHIQNKTRNNKNNFWNEENEENQDNAMFNAQYFQPIGCKIDRGSNKYKELQKKIIELKERDNNKFRTSLNIKYNESKQKKSLGYDVYYHYCNHEIMESFETREEAAMYLLDIEYYQEEIISTDKCILWNCFGDILYAQLIKNLKLPDSISTKKLAYQSRSELELSIENDIAEIAKELEESNDVNIYQEECDWFCGMECRIGSEHDRYLLYLLIVLYKRKLTYIQNLNEEERKKFSEDSKNHIKIYKNLKYGKKVTNALLDKWIEKNIAKKALMRLEKNKIIKIVQCERYNKIYLNPPFKLEIKKEKIEPLFLVQGGKRINPLMYYYKSTSEVKVKECEICGKPFRVIGNTKTCSPSCSRKQKLKNKNGKK